MKFINIMFPNTEIINNGVRLHFVNGEYETSDKKEIELLKLCGYIPCETTMDESKPVAKKRTAQKEG